MKYNYLQKIYYSDEQNDEIVNFNLKPKKIDGKYKYLHKNPFYNVFSFILYFIFAKIIVWFYIKFRRIKIVNRKILKKQKGGYFVYANHTCQINDAFHPTYTCLNKKPHFVCSSINVNQPVLGKITPMLGALPLPDTLDATRNFNKAMEQIVKKHPIVIYPEAHLWPYYTKIRPFGDKSFRYPVQLKKPVYTFTTTHQLKKPGKKPKIVVYVDGPFYPDYNLSPIEQRKDLHDKVFNSLVENSKNSNYEYLTYIKKNQGDN